MRRLLAGVVLVVSAAGCAAGASGGPARPAATAGPRQVTGPPPAEATAPGSPAPPAGTFDATVTRVVDGDTVVARTGDRRRVRVRLIGVDAPESVKPHTPVACYGHEASAFTRRLLTGVRVRAAYETGGRTDRFGRDLWDVWLPDGRFVQGVLAASGTVRAYPYRPQVAYAGVLRTLVDDARLHRRGLWGSPCVASAFPGRSP